MLQSDSLSLDLTSGNDSPDSQLMGNVYQLENEKYKMKYKRLRKMIKDMIFVR